MAADVELAQKPASAATRMQAGDGKLSRYRSVRKAQLKPQGMEVPSLPPLPTALPEETKLHENIQRSMSRYHHKQPLRSAEPPVPSARTPAAAKATTNSQIRSPRLASHDVQSRIDRAQPEFGGALQRRAQEDSVTRQVASRGQGTLLDQQARRKAPQAGSTEGELVLAKERERYERIKAQQRAERAVQDSLLAAERRKKEAEEAEIRRAEEEALAEQERVRQAEQEERDREAREKAAAKQREKEEKAARKRRPTNVSMPTQTPESTNSSSRGSEHSPESSRRIGGFFRRKKEDETSQPSLSTDEMRPKTSYASPPRLELPTIRPGGGGIVPLSDAPVSGVAGAERRVRIRFGKSEINLPVEATTSAQQLIKSASNIMSEQFNPRAAVIYEHYRAENVRRPLRMYEHVQKVMNSWEDDHQNYLQIEPSDLDADHELYESHAPQQHQLRQFERWLMCQYKPGKFDDRWITLRTDGQILAAKNQSGKDVVNVCNLSDFDIYVPILEPRRQRKKTKRINLWIKSQQKSAMFLDKSDFIHAFYTEEKRTADEFLHAVQAWRSYYLVNKMGQGKTGMTGELTADSTGAHKRSKSAESHYMLGSFNDLGLDFSNFARPPEAPASEKRKDSFDENKPLGAFGLSLPSAQEHSRMMHQKQLSQRKERPRAPPTAMRHGIPNRLGGRDDALHALNGSRQSLDSVRHGDDAFKSDGLLGSQYEQRRHNAKTSQDYGGGLQRHASVRSVQSQRRNSIDSAILGRQKSVRQPDFGRPLIDLTPQYKEPPQFAKRGKGFKPDHLGAGGLIDNATTPDDPLGLPGNNDWRARPTTAHGDEGSKGLVRAKSTRKQANGVPDGHQPFIKGLLAQSGRSGWGGAQTGHGVLSGNHAKGPMLDMHEESKFKDGTLLRKVEAQNLGNPVER